jgi:hypothetical protein
MLPPQGSEWATKDAFEFPGNLAVLSPSVLTSLDGGSESGAYHGGLLAARPYRKPPRSEGVTAGFLASTRALWETGNKRLEAEIDELKTKYVFRNEDAITQHIARHRATPAVLLNALPALRKHFGEDVVFNLEAVREDHDSTSLYAIVVWRGLTEGAEAALEDFDEHWWLNQPSQPGLTFTYELA